MEEGFGHFIKQTGGEFADERVTVEGIRVDQRDERASVCILTALDDGAHQSESQRHLLGPQGQSFERDIGGSGAL